MEFGSQIHHQTLFFVRFDPHDGLVLRVVEQFAEFLEAVFLPVEVGLLFLDPGGEIVGRGAVFHLQAMRFQHVAQNRQRFLGLGGGFSGSPAISPLRLIM